MKYGIIGTGAIGGYYGSKLARAGHDVHFLFHRDYDYVQRVGLKINSYEGFFHLEHLNAYHYAYQMPKCDVVLVGLKTVNEHLLPELLGPLLKKNTLVVLIQNGLGVEADVQKMLPDQPLAAGLAFICASKTSPGVVDHQDYGSINIGNYSCKSKRKMSMLIRDFKSAGIKVGEVEYNEARWKKAVWNLPFNGLSVVLDTPTDRLLTEKATRALVYDLMMEVIGAAQACGVETLTSDFADQMMAMTESMSPYLPSMKLDYDHHRPMEIYYLYTHPIEIARQAGFDMPKLAMLEAELKFREQSYEWKRY